MKIKILFLFVVLFFSNSNAQDIQLVNKIVGNNDSSNYYIGHFPVSGTDGLDLHWFGGIRFGDYTSNSVMQIKNGQVGIGTPIPQAKLDVVGSIQATSFKISEGTSAQFLKANGTVDTSSYQLLLTNPVTGTGSVNYLPKFTKASVVGNSKIIENGSLVSLNYAAGTAVDTRLSILNTGTGGAGKGTAIVMGVPGKANNVNGVKINAYTTAGETANQSVDLAIETASSGVLTERIRIKDNGNVGIGTPTPTTRLEVGSKSDYENESMLRFQGAKADPANYSLTFDKVVTVIDGTPFYDWQINQRQYAGNNGNVMTFYRNGNVGIGTLKPDAKLTVKGRVHAEEVVVDINVPADYVFESDYKLMPLNEVEQFVKANGHLPEIPSAAEIKEKGLNMGEMQNKLLQKVEELTLYMIELKKENEVLRNQMDEFKNR